MLRKPMGLSYPLGLPQAASAWTYEVVTASECAEEDLDLGEWFFFWRGEEQRMAGWWGYKGVYVYGKIVSFRVMMSFQGSSC